jgi:hypothetical protein
MKTSLSTLGALAALLVITGPAHAEHNSLATPDDATVGAPLGATTDSSLDITLKLGANGFRLGSRLFGRDGYAGGAWLNGETRPDGFSLDGRFERDGRAHNFKMNVDLDEWLRRAARFWGRTDL